MMHKFVLILLAIFIISCTSENKERDYKIDIHNSLSFGDANENNKLISGSLELSLDDSLIVNTYSQVQYNIDTDQLIVLDNNFGRLIFYNINSGKKDSSLNLFHKGRRATGKIKGFIYNDNTAYFKYSLKEENAIIFNDFRKNEEAVFKLKSDNRNKNPYAGNPDPIIGNLSPMYLNNDILQFSGYIFGEHDLAIDSLRFLLGKINLKEKKIEYFITYPETYYNKNWGADFYRIPYTTGFIDNKIILSLPASNELYIQDNKELKKIKNTSKNLTISSLPQSKKKFSTRKNDDIIYSHYKENYSYGTVIYDPYKKRIIRFLENPASKENEQKPSKVFYKPKTALIFDDEFNFLKEVVFPDYLSTSNFFVKKTGIYFLNLKNENENIAKYYRMDLH